ncbi:MAG: DUF559 domain-containing protein [Devosia sp.]
MPDDEADVELRRKQIWHHVSDHFHREVGRFSAWCRGHNSVLDSAKFEPMFEYVTQSLFDAYDDQQGYENVRLNFDEPGWRLENEYVRWLEDDLLREMRLLFALCESPIEQLLGAAILTSTSDGYGDGKARFSPLRLRDDREGTTFTPQYQLLSYRADFAFRTGYLGQEQFLVVECDGHDFHDRTKEQASRDRARDRTLLEIGIPVIRFTGRDVWADAMGCAEQISDQLSRHAEQMIEKKVSPRLRSKLNDLK